MIHRNLGHIAQLAGMAVAVALSVEPNQVVQGDLPADSATKNLSDAPAGEASLPAAAPSFRLSDGSLSTDLPRLPVATLRLTSDAAYPIAPAETDPQDLRALPPIALESSPAAPEGEGQLGPPALALKSATEVAEPWPIGADAGCDIYDACGGHPMACECRLRPAHEAWHGNAQVFIAGDGWKNIFDDDDNNNFGFRGGFNAGFQLPGGRGVCGQLGMSYGAYDFHGREELLSRDDPIEQQVFATAGIFKRSSITCGDRLAWGAVYDLLVADEAGERADQLHLAQLRARVGWAFTPRDEIGAWVAMRLLNDYAEAQRVKVNVTDQASLFWHHTWKLGGDTSAYAGWADDPGSVVIGLNGRVPLNHRVALFGNVHYIIPSTTGGDIHPTLAVDDSFAQEAWNVSLGIMFYCGGQAASPNVSGVFGLPLLSVADNGSFSYQANMF